MFMFILIICYLSSTSECWCSLPLCLAHTQSIQDGIIFFLFLSVSIVNLTDFCYFHDSNKMWSTISVDFKYLTQMKLQLACTEYVQSIIFQTQKNIIDSSRKWRILAVMAIFISHFHKNGFISLI